ncbi:MAG: hypothetical protein AAF383_03850 [Cyanobacteria bacterium P01_A01_bin.83]
MIAHDSNATQICADQLTEGDIIRHFTGDVWQVISEPEYVSTGISFEVLCLDVEMPPNIQQVVFAPAWRFELLDYQPILTT